MAKRQRFPIKEKGIISTKSKTSSIKKRHFSTQNNTHSFNGHKSQQTDTKEIRDPKSNKQILSDKTESSFPDQNPQKDMQSESLETVKQLEIAEMEDSTPHLKSTASIGKISSFSRNLLRFKACMRRFWIFFLPLLALVPAK